VHAESVSAVTLGREILAKKICSELPNKSFPAKDIKPRSLVMVCGIPGPTMKYTI
jgi:hypothetical protein